MLTLQKREGDSTHFSSNYFAFTCIFSYNAVTSRYDWPDVLYDVTWSETDPNILVCGTGDGKLLLIDQHHAEVSCKLESDDVDNKSCQPPHHVVVLTIVLNYLFSHVQSCGECGCSLRQVGKTGSCYELRLCLCVLYWLVK